MKEITSRIFGEYIEKSDCNIEFSAHQISARTS